MSSSQESKIDEKAVELVQDSTVSNLAELDDGREPTDIELQTLRHVAEKIPLRCWLVAIVELAERFSYYGLSAPFQNYMQNTPQDSPKGLLGLNQHGATALSYFFQFWCYITPILGGWIADTYWGKYKTITFFCVVYVFGIFILLITSIPSFNTHSSAMGGFITALVIIGLGTGGVKANVSPLIADQVPTHKPVIKVLKSGELVIKDPNITIQNVFMFFYMMINIGSLSVIATTQLEHKINFWAAYLLPFCFFFIAIFCLVFGKKYYIKRPVGEKIVNKTFHCALLGIKNKFNLDAAKPSLHPEKNYPWTDHFVEEVKRSLYACKVFIFYPVYWLVYGQMVNNFISQAGQMEIHGLPNDILQAINSITIIIFIPICERWIYPLIRRFTPFRAITKIFFGFMFAASAMVYAAVLQHFVYSSGPCYEFPKKCAPEFQTIPNHIHVAIQAPAYMLIALSEILASITGLEYAYTKAPASMKSFITSLFLVTYAIGAAIGIALSTVSKDPKMVWTYTGIGTACFIAGCTFWLIFKHYNDKEIEHQKLDWENKEEPIDGLKPVLSLAHSARSIA